MYGALDISTSGLIAQRTRLESITANLVNAETRVDERGRNIPFARRIAYFSPGDPRAKNPEARGLGVHVSRIGQDRSFTLRYEPGDELADADGYVKYPNINPTLELMNMYDASRAYEANLAAAEAGKAMMAQALRLLA